MFGENLTGMSADGEPWHTQMHTGDEEGYNIGPPSLTMQFSKKLGKNSIKPDIGDPPGNFLKRALTPPG